MSVNEKAGDNVYIGVDMGGTNLRVALVDPGGKILDSRKIDVRIDLGAEAVSESLAAQCVSLARAARKNKLHVQAIGLGVAGKIDRAGTVLFSPNLPPLDGYPLGDELRERTKIPVFMENDANVFGLGEGFAGAAMGMENWAGITLGTGTGGCLILGGTLWEGDGLGFCGEIGHMIIEPEGPRCPCGSKGCLEAFASARGLVTGAERLLTAIGAQSGPLYDLWRERALSSGSMYECAKNGDPLSIALFEKLGWALGIAISNIFTVLGIRNAVIGGGVSAAWDLFIEPLQASLSQSLSMLDPELALVHRASLGDSAALIGAARVAQIGIGLL